MKSSAWGFAVAVGVLVAALVMIPQAHDTAHRTQQFVLSFEFAASRAANTEVFIDRANGAETLTAMSFPVVASSQPQPHRVPLPPGRYRAIRIDPFGEDGDFVIQNVQVHDRYGRLVSELDLSRVEPSPYVVIRERTPGRLAGSAPVGRGDPWLRLPFDDVQVLWLSRLDLAWFAALAIALGGGVSVAVLALQRFDRAIRVPALSRAHAHPRLAIVLVGALATLSSMYPLFFGHSLVTPNNGPRAFVYSAPPYVPGSTDMAIEDARGADVQATMWVTLPYAVVQRRALADGEFPWWNRYSENGAPLLGQAQTSLFDPLQWIVLAGDLALAADLKYVAARLVFVIGIGCAALAAVNSIAAALVATGLAAFIGHFIGRLNDPIYFSLIYAPWILVAFAAMLRSRTGREAAGGAAGLLIATALLTFASSVKETFALLPALYLAGGVAIVLHERSTGSWRLAAVKIAFSAVAALGAGLLTAPHWLVFFETLASASTAYDVGAMLFDGVAEATALVLGALTPAIVHPGVNPVVAVLVLLLLLRPHAWRRQPLLAGCAVVTVAFLFIAFGGVPDRWLALVPLMTRVHHIGSTFVTAVIPLLLVMAAGGAAALPAYAGVGPWQRAALAMAMLVVSVVPLASTVDLANVHAGAAIVAAACVGVLTYCVLDLAASPTLMRAIVSLALAAGLVLPSGLHLPTGVAALDGLLMQPRERAPLTTLPDELIPARDDRLGPSRVAGINGVLQGGIPTYLGLEGVTGADALFSPYTRWLGQQFEMYYPIQFRVADARRDTHGPLLDLWGVRWIARPDGAGDRLAVSERPSAWPRAFFVDRVEQHGDRLAFLRRLLADSRPFASVQASDPVALDQLRSARGPHAAFVAARDYHLTANTTSFTIDSPSAGVVVLNEGLWPGVSATVAGAAVPVFRVNETMRGIAVPAGTSRVRFVYRPTQWTRALLLAAAGGTIWLALLLVSVRPTVRR